MKLCGIFLVLALAGGASAASIGQPLEHPHTFTAELGDGFVATLPKSALAAADDKDNSLDPSKASPAAVAQETHIPVAVVQEPEKIVTKKIDTVKFMPIAADVPKLAIEEEKKEEALLVPEASDNKPEESKTDEPQKSEEKKECEEPKKENDAEKLKEPSEDKDKKEEEVKQVEEVVEQTKQAEVSGEGAPASPPPNIIQQGIMNFQQGLNNIQQLGQSITSSIGSTIASLVTPNNNTAPSNIFNWPNPFQNIVRPQGTAGDTATSPNPGIFEGIQSFSQGIQQGIQNMQQSFQNFISSAFGANQNNNINRNSSNILEQSIQSLQIGVQNGLYNLNKTIQTVTHPERPGLIQSGIINLQNGVQNITTGISNLFRPPANGSQSGVIQQTVQSLSQGLESGVQNLNNTIQNIIKPASGENGSAAAPATRETLEQAFLNELRAINATLQEGIKTLTSNLQDVEVEHKEVEGPVGDAMVIAV